MAEAKWTGVLSTTEPRNDIGILNVRQGNLNSETVEFQIVQNNKPYDLTETKVYFCTNFGLSAVEKSAVIKDAINGIITFTFNDQSMQEVGRQMAYFQITKDEVMIDSTQDFEFRIESSLLSRLMQGGSYIERFEKLLETLGDNAAFELGNGLTKALDLLSRTMTLNEFDSWVATLLDGGPSIFKPTYASLVAAYPDGPTKPGGIALVKENDHKYVWNGTSWEDYGIYQAVILPDNSLSVDKTNFINTGKNKFNEATMKSGYRGTDGVLYPNNAYKFSEMMVVKSGDTFSFSRAVDANTHVREAISVSFIAAYDDTDVVPEAGGRTVSTYTVPEGITRIIISSPNATMEQKFQMELGTSITSYEKYKRTVNYLKTTVENSDVVKNSLDADRLRLPAGMLPKLFYFSNGTLNSGVFNPVSSNRVATQEIHFATKGSKLQIVVNTDTEFTVHLLDALGNYIKNTNWNSTYYQFEEDSYFRVSQKYKNDSVILETKLPYFNNGLVLSMNSPYSFMLKNEASLGSGPSTPDGKKIILPPSYPVVVGEEANVYLDNILQNGNAYTAENYSIRSNGAGGIIECGYQFKGVADRTLTFDYKEGDQLKLTNSLPVKVVAKSAGSGTKKMIIAGESTTRVSAFLLALIAKHQNDVTKIELLGSKGTAPALCEGYPGWKASNLVSSLTYKEDTNTFYNPTTQRFDFSYYMTKQGYASVDYVFLNFGINDVADGQSTTQSLASYKTMIDSIRAYNSNIKIIIGLTNLPSRHANENGNDLKNKLLTLIEALITTYGNREAEGFYLNPIYLNIDPFWDMKFKTVQLSSRNSKQVIVGDDLVHPSPETGYLKQADTHYNVIKYIASKG